LILLQTGSVGIDSQIIGAFIQVFFGSLIVIMAGGMGWAFSMLARHGERMARLETALEIFMTSSGRNHRLTAAEPNPVTEEEADHLDYVLTQGASVSYREIKRAAEIAFKEACDPNLPKEKREPYVNVLPVLDTRMALKAFDEERLRLPWWRRFFAGLGFG
jgi:hypothetical protein